MATYSSILAWRVLMDSSLDAHGVHGVAKTEGLSTAHTAFFFFKLLSPSVLFKQQCSTHSSLNTPDELPSWVLRFCCGLFEECSSSRYLLSSVPQHSGLCSVCAKVAQLCQTLCSSVDCSPPGSSVHGVLQVRTLEWVAIPFSKESSRTRD